MCMENPLEKMDFLSEHMKIIQCRKKSLISNAKIVFNNYFISMVLTSYIGALDIFLIRDSIGNNAMLITLAIILIFKVFGGKSSSCNMINFHLCFVANFY